MYTSCACERDPGKLSNSAKYLKVKEDVRGGESVMRGNKKTIAINKNKAVMQI